MKKNLLKALRVFLFSALLFTGCKKVTEEELKLEDGVAGKEEPGQANTRTNDNDPGCRLKHVDYGNGYNPFTLDFKYNNRGLASEVFLDYNDGYFERHAIFYDRRNRLVKTRIISSDYPVILYDFSHTGNFITRANGYFEGTNEPWRDIRYSYNRKGQMSNLDDIVQDLHMRYFYNRQGDNTHGELYFGNELFFSYDIAFNTPNRNPFLAVPGVPFGFWDVFLPLWNKRWEDNNRITMYENGSPIVVFDTDPSQTSMNTGPHNYLSSATKYDMISESFITETMTYRNCDGRNDDLSTPTSNAKKATGMNVMSRIKRIINGNSKNMKQELQELKREYLYKNKAKQK